jgi:hypothetical protein
VEFQNQSNMIKQDPDNPTRQGFGGKGSCELGRQ